MGTNKKYNLTQPSQTFIELTMKTFAVFTTVLAIIGTLFSPLVAQAVTHLPQADQPQTSALRGSVWDDANHDGTRQTTEHGFPGITITLYVGRVQVVTTTLTSTTGQYTFTNLAPMSYTVGFALPRDYAFTTPSNDSDVNASGLTDVPLNPGDDVSNIDAGIWRSALVSEEPPTITLHSVFLPMVSNSH